MSFLWQCDLNVSDSNNEDKMQSISKTILEESVKKIKYPVCGVETEPYYMKFHMCEKA
jgi:hypothetical protein